MIDFLWYFRKYPTKANIDLRKAEEVEKIQRGEIIKQTQNITKRKKKKVLRLHNRKRTTQKRSIQIFSDTLQQKKIYRGLQEFSGTCKHLIIIYLILKVSFLYRQTF